MSKINKRVAFLASTFLTACFLLAPRADIREASARAYYLWTHKISVSTTEQDSFFTVKWVDVTVYADSVDLMLTIGASDTADWDSREELFLPKGASIYFGPKPQIRRLAFKSVTGSGNIFFTGRKKSKQY